MVRKKACLIYVTATLKLRESARARLEKEGYDVCETLADIDEATTVKLGDAPVSDNLKACIDDADICVFLLPEDVGADGCMGSGAGYASEIGKPFIAVVEGEREALPPSFDDDAAGVVRDCDEGLTGAINGDPSFKKPDGTNVPPRKTDHVKCQ